MAENQIVDVEFQTVPAELNSSQQSIRNLQTPAVRDLIRSQSRSIEMAMRFCGVPGRPPVCYNQKPRMPQNIPGHNKTQVVLEKFEDILPRLQRMFERKDSDHQQCVAVAEIHNSGNESDLTELN